MSLKQQLNADNVSKSYLEMCELYRRLYLSRYIFLSFFSSEDRDNANKHYNNISKIADFRDLTVSETIGEIVDLGKCPEDTFFEVHIEYLQLVAYYLLIGNAELEFKFTTEEQRSNANKKANEIVGKLMELNIKNQQTI